MADPHARVELTASFVERPESIEAFQPDAGAPQVYDKLLDGLRHAVIPNLRRIPRIGRRHLDNPPQSAEAPAQLHALPPGAAEALREYLHGDHLILRTLTGSTVYLLSIRHHRHLSFALPKLWEPRSSARDKKQLTEANIRTKFITPASVHRCPKNRINILLRKNQE